MLASFEASLVLAPAAGGLLSGPNVEIPGYHRLFGGQLLAQSLVAACFDAGAERVVRSVHLVFVAEGTPASPVSWRVSPVRVGRTFSTLSVLALQEGRELAAGVVSLHVPEDGFSHALAVPAVADHSSLQPVPPGAGAMPCEMRVDGDVRLDGGAIGPPELAVWMRPPRALAGGALVSQTLLAYCSDATMMVAALRPHGAALGSPALGATSVTSHTVSFHRPFVFDDWLLFAQQSPAAFGGRAYARGDWFAGELVVASCAQEMLIRPAPAGGS